MHARPRSYAIVASALLVALAAAPALADQKIKTKSNIKNDRVASACSQDCAGAGRQWARDNRISDTKDCASVSEAFTSACKTYVEETKPAAPASN